jgi:hypothetical protein
VKIILKDLAGTGHQGRQSRDCHVVDVLRSRLLIKDNRLLLRAIIVIGSGELLLLNLLL